MLDLAYQAEERTLSDTQSPGKDTALRLPTTAAPPLLGARASGAYSLDLVPRMLAPQESNTLSSHFRTTCPEKQNKNWEQESL